jgi:Protein of unknown function (DUF732)
MTEPITEVAETGLGSTDPGPISASNEAWSLELDESDSPTEGYTWPAAWLRAALLALCAAVIAGAIGVIGWTTAPRLSHTSTSVTRGHRPSHPATPAAAPRSHPVPVPLAAPAPAPSTTAAPSPTVRIEASPPVATEVPPPAPAPKLAPPPVFEDSQDQWLLNNLRSLGYTIINPSLVISNAHEACRLLQQGESTDEMNKEMQARMGTDLTDTLQLTSSAMLAFPNCY